MGWEWKKRYKMQKKQQHETSYGKPMCHLCDNCYVDKSLKHSGITYYCDISGNDVGQSHFGMNSPKNCPKRSKLVNI